MDNDEVMIQKIIEMLTKAEADRKAFQEKMAADRKADHEDFLARMHAFHEERMAMLDAHQKRMTACFGQTEARLEYEEPPSGNIKDDRNETTADNEATEKIEKNPGMMQSAEEHQDVPSKNVAVMLVAKPSKRRRVRKSNAGRGEPRKLNRGNRGSRNKLAAACRKVSRYATVAWRKRKLFRNSETRGYCGSRKGVTVADRRTSRHATVSWLKRNLSRRSGTQEFCGQRKELNAAGIRKIPCAQVVRRKRRSYEGPSVEHGIIGTGINLQEEQEKDVRSEGDKR
jgi:hypothetical protein